MRLTVVVGCDEPTNNLVCYKNKKKKKNIYRVHPMCIF